MLYLTPASGQEVREAIADGSFGQIVTPKSGDKIVEGATWALDNGCFSERWSESRWKKNIGRYKDVPNCLFAVIPDVVANAAATDELWYKWSTFVKEYGYKPAYFLQNGCTHIPDDAEAIFTGGDTDWKLGSEAREWLSEAQKRELWCHMGRVNSLKRLRYAYDLGYDSVDGTFIKFAPSKNLKLMTKWIKRIHEEY